MAPVLDVWYGFIASPPHLVYYSMKNADGQPDSEYLAAMRKRFGQWVLDTAVVNYHQKWLDCRASRGAATGGCRSGAMRRAPKVPAPKCFGIAIRFGMPFRLTAS